jgi:hypothetical protein
MNENPLDYDYEPAPVERSLAAARAILARLYDLPPLPVIGEGICDDCGRNQVLLQFGQAHVCRPCGSRRQRAARKAFEPIEVAA